MADNRLDYDKLGFLCGIEIHQQLDTHKLFCPCPSTIRDDEPDVTVERRMRAVPGEMGGVDPAALHEFLRGRKLVYEAYRDTNCLIELDEEPPMNVNGEALEISLQVALLLNAKPVSVIQVMRKTVVDGSNTSGFQRTMLVAEDGVLDTSMGPVRIPSICLEEDAARKIIERDGVVHYRLDRLGIPLVEIATDPDIKNPGHAREVAEKLGSILRACRVKRGLGTIRQDINVSIRDGERIEIKGVQDLKLIPQLVEKEVERQLMLVKLREYLEAKEVGEKEFTGKIVDLTETLSGSDSKVIRKGMSGKHCKVLGVRLPGLKGRLKDAFGPELAMYARASSNVKGLFHIDELPGYGITSQQVEVVAEKLGAGTDDAFAFIAGDSGEAEKALNAVIERCRTVFCGVPEETRVASADGKSRFMRPLPGSERMYPETDELLIHVKNEWISEIGGNLPELREEKARRYEEIGLSGELASQLSRDGVNTLFDEIMIRHPGADATTIATLLTALPKEAEKRLGADPENLCESHFFQMACLLEEGKIGKSSLVKLIGAVCESPGEKVGDTASREKLLMMDEGELEKTVGEVFEKSTDMIGRLGEKAVGPITGEVMKRTSGRADPEQVRKLILKRL